MTVDDYQNLLRCQLLRAGFDFAGPDPGLAWSVFKDLADEPVACSDSYLLWEVAGDYFDFVREFKHYEEDGALWFEQVTVHFTCSPPQSFGVRPLALFSSHYPDYDAFFRAVESRPEFVRGLTLAHWSVELRLDGC